MEIACALIFVWFLVDLSKKHSFSPPVMWLPIAVFLAVSCLSILQSDAAMDQKLYAIGRMRFFFFFLAIHHCLRAAKNLNFVLSFFFGIASIIGVYAAVQHFTPLDLVRSYENRVELWADPLTKLDPLSVGTFNHHLTYANIYLMIASLMGSVAIFSKRTFWFLPFVLLLLTCLWTQSRIAWLAVSISVFLLFAMRSRKKALYSLIVISLVLMASSVLDSGFKARLGKVSTIDNLNNSNPRVRLWAAHWELFQTHPWFGVGFGQSAAASTPVVDALFPEATPKFYGHAHSMFLEVLSGTGLIGFLAFLWIWWVLFDQLIAFYRLHPDNPLAPGLIVAFIGFQLQGLTQWNFGDAEVAHNLMFFWALAAHVSQKSLDLSRLVPRLVKPANI